MNERLSRSQKPPAGRHAPAIHQALRLHKRRGSRYSGCTMFFDTVLPALVLTACAVLLLRMVLPGPARQRLDAAGHALWRLLRHAPAAWMARRHQTQARREARAAIERARRSLRSGTPRPRRTGVGSAPRDGGAEVHDLAQHRRRRQVSEDTPGPPPDPGPEGQAGRAGHAPDTPPGGGDEPPPPSRPTLH